MTDYPRAVLRLGMTRERVDEGRLSKERIQSKVEKVLRCVGKGYIWRGHNPSSSYKDHNIMEMSLRGDMV